MTNAKPSHLIGLSVFFSLFALLAACAAVPPAQLVQARETYALASTGPAATLAPADLYEGKKALDQADEEFRRNGASPSTTDLAYIAQRRIEIADSKARTAADREKIDADTKRGVAVRDSQVRSTQSALADTRAQLKAERSANDTAAAGLQAAISAQGTALAKSENDLATEKQARAESDARLTGAMAELARIAAIKQEPRGLVITLSGSVLFGSGKAALLDSAKARLDQVAEALKAQSHDRQMVVEGHTDSRGTDAVNQPLSLERANAVRSYLVSRGVDSARITALGLGATRPLLDNGSAENRANNRRVEIVVSPVVLTAATPAQ